ncbi:MAG: BrnA antitoxin family protein [Endomicrobium sp.]|jgi:hypothetical protein|nr:BrnA antitoxin family protein [Endomicrobium sp.]
MVQSKVSKKVVFQLLNNRQAIHDVFEISVLAGLYKGLKGQRTLDLQDAIGNVVQLVSLTKQFEERLYYGNVREYIGRVKNVLNKDITVFVQTWDIVLSIRVGKRVDTFTVRKDPTVIKQLGRILLKECTVNEQDKELLLMYFDKYFDLQEHVFFKALGAATMCSITLHIRADMVAKLKSLARKRGVPLNTYIVGLMSDNITTSFSGVEVQYE